MTRIFDNHNEVEIIDGNKQFTFNDFGPFFLVFRNFDMTRSNFKLFAKKKKKGFITKTRFSDLDVLKH